MHINPRWQKILNDVWGNKQRSLLVILSISIGVGVVGMINNAQYLIQRDLIDAFGDGHPASVQIYTSPAQEDLAHAVADMRQVSDVQIRRVVSAGLILEGGVEDKINLIAVPDYEDIKVSQFTPDRGASVPGLRELVLERNSALKLGLAVGDQIIVKLPDETEYPLTITGIVHDIYEFPYSILGSATGYVSMPTLGWMGVGNYYNRIDLVVEGENSRESALNTAALARDRVIEPAGVVVGSIQIPGINSDPGQHWAQNQIQGFVLILQVMSVMAIFLSGGLVVNTVSAILTQQVRQIGIMRSIGAVRSQITGIYIFNVFVFAFLGWLIAIPLGLAGSWWLANFAANFLNFSLTTLNLAPGLFLLQTVIAFIVPVGVALFPILAGMAISVYDAVYQNGLINEGQKDLVERLLGRINFLSPPMVLSVLNTFRNIPRLAFTLVTLTLAGATFVAAFSTRDSLNAHVADLGRYMWYDAAIKVSGSASRFTAEREALRVPGVVVSEGWAAVSGIEILPDGQEGEAVSIVGLPYDSVMLNPEITSGRWLDQPDSWQVVINEDYLDQNDTVGLGSQLTLKVGDTHRIMQVVGVTSKTLSGPRVYINYPMISKLTGRNDQVDEVRVRTDMQGLGKTSVQDQIAEDLEERFFNAGLSRAGAQTNYQSFGFFNDSFQIILMILLVMAGLLAVVGGLSLAGTMSINVMERTREIGVLRSVGASNFAVRQVVVVEGVAIALLSWLLVLVISIPSGLAMAGAVVTVVLRSALNFRFSLWGLLIWLLLVVLIGIFSSLAPAQRAVSLTVREVLDYE